MKFICLHHRLGGLTSHHFNEAHGLGQEFNRRGEEFVLLVSQRAPAPIAAELHARAVLEDDPTFHFEWSFEERSRRFVSMLHDHVDGELGSDDCVMITISTQLEAHALTCWLQELSHPHKPWIVILFLSDRWNRSGREEYERQVAEFHILRTAISSLARQDGRRLIFCTVSELLAEELSDLLGTPVGLTCMPMEYGNPPSTGFEPSGPHLPCVAVLGGTRREKGSYLIPDVVKACRSIVRVEFLIHLANNSLSVEEVGTLAAVDQESGVTVIPEAMTLPQYRAALHRADLMLFPYEVIPYRKRTSGVFAEAVAYGKPVLATRGTWMAGQIEAGDAAGIIFEDLLPNTIAAAIGRGVTDLQSLQQSARALSTAWRRKVCLQAFIDYVEQQIALRANG